GAEHLQGPDVITALGIALAGVRGGQMPPVRVRVDGRPVCLFLPDRCTVREAARIAGLPLHRLTGRMGSGLTVTVNGEPTVIPGTRGTAATVHVNNEPATLDTVLNNQDEVQLGEPRDGAPPLVTVGELVARWLAQQATAKWPRVSHSLTVTTSAVPEQWWNISLLSGTAVLRVSAARAGWSLPATGWRDIVR